MIQSISTDPETRIANFPFSLTVTVANQDEGVAVDTFQVGLVQPSVRGGSAIWWTST